MATSSAEPGSASAIEVCGSTLAELMGDPDILALLAEYEAEAKSPELPAAQPQWEQYAALERAGALDVIAAYEGARLIGFVAVLRASLPHYGGGVCVVESIFVTAERRRTGAGRALIRAAEAVAAHYGTSLLVTAPAGSALEVILPRLGYRHSNTVFVRAVA
jgi:GNAT superfamily N-acetyltransferase